METLIDHCAACGFDARSVSVDEVTDQIGSWGGRVAAEYRSCPAHVRRVRPADGRWSAGEYLLHLVHALSTSRWFVEQGLAAERPTLEPPDPDKSVVNEDLGTDDELLGRLGRRVDRLAAVLRSMAPGEEERTVVIGWSRIRGTIGEVCLVDVARNALHELVHHHRDLVEVRDAVEAQATGAVR
jgi:hypothetical protein